MFTKISFGKILVSVLVIAFLLIATTGCQSSAATTAVPLPVTGGESDPTSTPKPIDSVAPIIPNTLILLPDGSKIILKPGAKIEILSQPGIPSSSASIVVNLMQGEILALPNLESKVLFSVQSSDGYGAQIQGCAMTVKMDTKSDLFEMQCIGGSCEIGANSANMVKAGTNNVWKLVSGILAEPVAVDFKQLALDYPEGLPACVADSELLIPETGGSAPTDDNSPSLTATAACAQWLQQFPSTPCAP